MTKSLEIHMHRPVDCETCDRYTGIAAMQLKILAILRPTNRQLKIQALEDNAGQPSDRVVIEICDNSQAMPICWVGTAAPLGAALAECLAKRDEWEGAAQ